MTINNIELLIKLLSTTKAIYANIGPEALIDILQDQSDFTEVEALEFVKSYAYVSGSFIDNASGFQAAIFLDKASGKKVLAIRGSEELYEDFGDADFADIGPNGFATSQAVDLYRYWKRLTAPADEYVEYSASEIAALWRMYELGDYGVIIDVAVFATQLATDKGLGLIEGDAVVDVTGHSLGGNLAYVFASMFPENTDQVVTINAPGIDRLVFNGEDSLLELGFSLIDESKVTSLNAEGDLVHFVGGAQPGGSVEISQEVGHGLIDGFALNHSVINGLDSLHVSRLFSLLDPSQLNYPSGILKSFMRSASFQGIDTYENLVDGLRSMLLGAAISKTPLSSKSDLEERNILFNNMNELKIKLESGGDLNYLVGKVNLVRSSVEPSIAKNNYGQFLSLYFLTPFSISGDERYLKNLNPELYALWSADIVLTPSERNNDKANFSDAWYQDRAAMLAALISRNEEDEINDTNTNKGENDILFLDKRDSLNLLSEGSNGDKTHVINFGGSQADELTGGAYSDRIYGMDGNDKLNGLGGHDALFGGAGDDELIGGEGSDLLVGGKDKDTLIGEAGNDILKGGEGDDTYKFTGNFGRDIIIDNAGSNTLDINGAIGELTQTSKDSLIYSNASNTVEVILIEEGGKKSLLINSLSNSGSSITIDNWVSGQFGITLKEFESEESPSLHIINGNANANQLFPYFEENQHYSASEIHGGAGGDFIHGSSGDDKLYGDAGDDWITAGNNRGKFSSLDPTKIMIPAGGGGKDFIDGGDGDDVISGIAEGSTWLGGDGNDMLLGGSVFHMFRFNGPSVDGTSDDVRASIAWQDFSQHFKKGFKADKKTVGTINEHGYSAWAGIEPGTYTGVSAHGNGWQYKIEVTNSTPLLIN